MITTENYIREVVIIFFAQKKIIVGTWLLVALFALGVSLFWPPTYQVEGSILVKSKNVEKAPEALEETELKIFEVRKKDLLAEIEILKSPDVVSGAIEKLAKKKLYFTEKDLERGRLKKAVHSIRNRLKLRDIEDSNIIEARLEDQDAQRALTVLEVLMEVYIAQRSAIFNPERSVEFFEKQTEKFDRDLFEQEALLGDLARKCNSANPTKEIENNLALGKALKQQLDSMRLQLIEKKKMAEYLRKHKDSGGFGFFSDVDNVSIRQLGEKLQTLFVERGTIMRTYHKESEKVEAISEQIQDVYQSLQNEVSAYLAGIANEARIAENGIREVENRLARLDRRNIELHACEIESNRIHRRIELLSFSYETFKKRLEEARINADYDTGDLFSISVLSKPYYSGSPVFPNPRTIVPAGIVAGLFLSLTLGYLNEFFDHTFKKPGDSEKYAGVPTIFSIPDWSDNK